MKLLKIPFLGRGGIGFHSGKEGVAVYSSTLAIRIIPCPNHAKAKTNIITWLREIRNLFLRGDRNNYGVVGRRVVTTAFINYLRDCINPNVGSDPTIFKYHDMGTGIGAEAIGNTGLGTPWGGARVSGTQSASVAKTYITVATITVNNTFAITEHGVFSAATSGTLMDRTVFAAKTLQSGDGIEFTYSLTIHDGA
jgi:hypothetical protein